MSHRPAWFRFFIALGYMLVTTLTTSVIGTLVYLGIRAFGPEVQGPLVLAVMTVSTVVIVALTQGRMYQTRIREQLEEAEAEGQLGTGQPVPSSR